MVAGVLVAAFKVPLTIYALASSNPQVPADGIAVGKELRAGIFGNLRPGDIARLRKQLRPTDRFFVAAPGPTEGYGDSAVVNARLLLGSALLPNVMVGNARAADAVIRIGMATPVPRGAVTTIRPGVELIRTRHV